MSKVLFVASVGRHITAFHLPYLKRFKEKGYETHVAAHENTGIQHCDKFYDIPIERNPLKKGNIIAYKQLRKIIREGEYDIIHCHTPVASILTRIASIKERKKGTKVIYTAHGFHFCKGAPILNWLIYFPIEWICSFFTDVLININEEDYNFSKKHMHARRVEYVPGVGIDPQKYVSNDRKNKTEIFGVKGDDIVILSVGELNKNKNHEVILKAIKETNNPKIHYFIAGVGNLEEHLKNLAKELSIEDRFCLLGYRNDINELLSGADLFCFPSYREGLPVSVMEAMASGLPIIASKIRGNKDLVKDGRNGFLVDPANTEGFKVAINTLINDDNLKKEIEENNISDIKRFDIENVAKIMERIYIQ